MASTYLSRNASQPKARVEKILAGDGPGSPDDERATAGKPLSQADNGAQTQKTTAYRASHGGAL